MKEANVFLETIKVNNALQEIDRAYNDIGHYQGVKSIAEAIKFNSALIKLNIGIDGAKEIAEAIKMNSTLLEIYCMSNNIGVQGDKCFAEAIEVNYGWLISLIMILELQAGAEFIAEAIKENIGLKMIEISSNNIGDQGVKAIAGAIKVNSTLQSIHLSRNIIGDEGAKAIAEAIQVNSSLEEIDLWSNNFGTEGVQSIAKSIKQNFILHEIYRNDIEAEISYSLNHNFSRKKKNNRAFICAFSEVKKDLIRLRFDKMIFQFVYYPFLGVN
jgi:hypothetical protein